MSQYFHKPYKAFGENINVKGNFFNYAAKADSKEAAGADTSNFALKSNLASLKAEVGKIDVDNVVNNDVVKKTVYDKLIAKVNNIDTSEFVLRTKYDTDKSDLEKQISDAEKKISDTSGLFKRQV